MSRSARTMQSGAWEIGYTVLVVQGSAYATEARRQSIEN
jgi:hypothetical protein